MDGQMKHRVSLAGAGALAGVSLWVLTEYPPSVLTDQGVLVAYTLVLVFFSAMLGLAGPLSLRRAALSAAPVALITAGLVGWAAYRFDQVADYMETLLPITAGFVLGFIPLPFLIAAQGRKGWSDYPTLFSESWSMVVRAIAAWLFVGLVWGAILLSDALLGLVNLHLWEVLTEYPVVPMALTGAVLGLGLAVVVEMADVVSPYLVLRLLRLLTLPVLAVMMLFLLALPVQGLSGLWGGVSAALTMLLMAAAAATLVTTVIDQTDLDAAASSALRWGARGLALILPLPAALAAFALWLRVGQYGWTPDRLFASSLTALGLGYGGAYAVAVLRGAGWMARIRQANVVMALVGLGLAALWLSPVLNAQRISANSQLARFTAGETSVNQLDLFALDEWGIAGQTAITAIRAQAESANNPDLTKRLADFDAGNQFAVEEPDATALLEELATEMPLQPPGATATRDMLLAAATGYDLQNWLAGCREKLAGGTAGCVFVVADFWPNEPGEEGILIIRETWGGVTLTGFGMTKDGLQTRMVAVAGSNTLDTAVGEALIAELQANGPTITPAPINQLQAGPGLYLIP